jgi:hypothetical protein
MTTPPTPETPRDRHDLLGAYALDALDDADRAQVDELIARDPVARREADELRDTAALLGLTAGAEPAPPGLWDRIASAIDQPRERVAATEPAPVASLDAARAKRGSRWDRPAWIVGIAAAVALVIGIGVGYAVHHSASNGSDLTAAYSAAARAGEEHVVRDATTKQPIASVAWDEQAGAGYLRNDSMAALPAGQVYQLWVVPPGAGAKPVSVGVLGGTPAAVSSFHWSGPMAAVAVSVEPAPGAVTPTKVIATT